MITIIISLLLAILIGVAQFLSEEMEQFLGNYYTQVISFAAGISITYLFLDLLPHYSLQVVQQTELLFLSLLFGFIFVHLIEKYLYQHSKQQQLEKNLAEVNLATSFSYHFILGIIIVDFIQQSLDQAILFFIPILIFTAVSTLPVRLHFNVKWNIFVSSATVLGVIIALFFSQQIPTVIFNALLGFVIGALLFSVIRHSLPPGKKGKPLFFVIGVLVYTPIILLSISL